MAHVSLARAIAEAPYASLNEEEAKALASRIRDDARGVAAVLASEAGVHEMCDNMIKAEVLHELRDRVWAVRIGVPYANQIVCGSHVWAVCPKCGKKVELKAPKDGESRSGTAYADHYIAEHA